MWGTESSVTLRSLSLPAAPQRLEDFNLITHQRRIGGRYCGIERDQRLLGREQVERAQRARRKLLPCDVV